MTTQALDNVLPWPLSKYDIDPQTGFLPPEEPLHRLPADGPFNIWERLMDDLQGLLLTGTLRARILKLPILDVDLLTTVPEHRRAYLVLSMLTHAYVWGKHEPAADVLPACLAIPFCKVSEMLGILPVATSASCATWNWKRLDPEGPYDLSNLITLHTFSGSMDESWFYLITTAIEARGGRAICAMLAAAKETLSATPSMQRLAEQLTILGDEIAQMAHILNRMYERCDPYVFFWKVRVYLAGWSNMKEAGLPNGLHYEGVDAEGIYREYPGGSAGQSALMHSLDLGLGIQHNATGKNTGRNQFMLAMRKHMPATQRQFLVDLETKTDIRSFIQQLASHETVDTHAAQVIAAYDRCVDQLKQFRDRHIQMVTLYVIMPARKGPVVGGHRSVAGTMMNEKPTIPATLATGHGREAPLTPHVATVQHSPHAPDTAFRSSRLYPQAVASGSTAETGSDTPALTSTPSPGHHQYRRPAQVMIFHRHAHPSNRCHHPPLIRNRTLVWHVPTKVIESIAVLVVQMSYHFLNSFAMKRRRQKCASYTNSYV
ncbi:Indoleamine 2,3-dioxygenase-domain-containing protein [Syncephalis fuscata]|nr:Indoleamine 2,3-dioxygenase-domain-containing protein [Syncephalis fuscata]